MGDRFLVFGAGLCGAAGVALSAMAAHRGGPNMMVASTFLLIHAAALLAVGLATTPRPTRIGAWILFAGIVFFAGDLTARELIGSRLFPMSAPLGGILMIAGWLVVAGAALLDRPRSG